jgi:hypothetical protein
VRSAHSLCGLVWTPSDSVWSAHGPMGECKVLLRMIIHSKGSTGKSRVIQTATEYFIQQGAKHLLKATYTGIATSLINGKARDNNMTSMDSFGSINFIFCGNFHQFPPLACPALEALYQLSIMIANSIDSQLSHAIYKQFNTIVILKEQMCMTDPVWKDFLTHLCHGCVQEHHLALLQKQIIKNPGCPNTNFDSELWDDTSLVMPKHTVWTQWNDTAVCKHC